MVKKKSFLDILAKPLIISAIVVYVTQLASVFVIPGIMSIGSSIKLSIWQDIVFPIAAFGTGWVIAKIWRQSKPLVAGVIFSTSAILWSAITWWLWGKAFEIFLWHWWHNGSALAVQLISAFVIQLLVTVFVFGKRTSIDRIRSQLYFGVLTVLVILVYAITTVPSIPHVLSFYNEGQYAGSTLVISLFFMLLGPLLSLVSAIIINTAILYRRGTKMQLFLVINLFAVYASFTYGSLVSILGVGLRPLHDPLNLYSIALGWVVAFGLDIWVMLYFRRHLPLRKG